MIQILFEAEIDEGFMREIDKGISIIKIDPIAARTEPHVSRFVL